MNAKIVTLDVCADIRNGREPFSLIMSTIATLKADEQLRLIAPFEPVPLFHVLARQGFEHTAQVTESGSWEVLFTRQSELASAEATESVRVTSSSESQVPTPTGIMDVDARGLEPPQPMVRILESLTTLPAGAELRAHTDRRPIHLYPQLEARGFTAQTEEQSDGTFITHIRSR